MIKPDILLRVTGNLQLFADQEAGVEVAVHAVRALFNDESTEAALQAMGSTVVTDRLHYAI